MKQPLIWIIAILLLACAVYAAEVDKGIEEQIAEEGKADVIVTLKDQPIERDVPAISGMAVKNVEGLRELREKMLEEKKEMIDKVQEKVLKNLDVQKRGETFKPKKRLFGILGTKRNPDLKLEYQYNTINAFSGEITREGLEKLKGDDNVEHIEIVRPVVAFLDVSIPQIKANGTWRLVYNGTNLTGAGETVCILDTGVDYRHDALGNCTNTTFLAGNCSRVISGYDFVNNDNDPMDDNNHGTHCAGIVASDNDTYRGVAPAANIVAIKVLSSTGSGSTSTLVAGIDWCTDNSSEYNISAISMSLGVLNNYNQYYCDDDYTSERDAINTAVGVGIFVAIASGNSAPYSSGISAPACIQNATPVGGVAAADDDLIYQRGTLLNIIAPAVNIKSTRYTVEDFNMFVDKSGTSMATPHVAGAAALLQQYKRLTANSSFTPQELEDLFNATGKQIYDDDTARNYSRLDVLAAVLASDSTAPEINITYPANNTAFNSSVTINATSNEALSSALLEWNGTNENMSGNSLDWYKTKYGHGSYQYRIFGNDSAGNMGVSETRIINITNFSPNITSFYPNAASVNIAEPSNQTFNITMNDAENNELNVSWYANGSLQLAGINQTAWNFTGNYSTAGNYNITAVASDGYTTDSNEWTLIVNNTNRAPVLSSAVPNQTWGMNANKTISLASYFSESDSEDMNFSSTAAENITVYINNDTDTAVLEPDANFTGARFIIFYAFDVYNANASSNNITLNITANHLPEAQNASVTCSDSLNRTNGDLTGFFSYYDADNDNQTANETKWYNNSVEVASLANLTNIGAGNTTKGQNWTFYARVYDGINWGDWASATIVIANTAPGTPTVSNPTDGSYYSPVNITYSSSDLDSDILYYYVYINNSLNSTSSANITNWTASDGYYSLKVSAYDNSSFSSNSSVIYFTKDTVVPVITAISSSGAVMSVTTNEAATCRYSSSDVSYDSMSAMSSTGSLSHSHSMSSSGTYYSRCMDTAGNKMTYSNSTYVTVSSGGDGGSSGGGGGGGGGGGAAPAVLLAATRKDTHTFAVLPQGSTTQSINKKDLAFTGYVININKILSSVTLTTEAMVMRPTGIPSPADSVYQYISVDANEMTSEDVDSVEITFKVSMDWITNFDMDSVRLNRYTTSWDELETERQLYVDGYYYYSAVSPGLSYFAITAKPKAGVVYEAVSEPAAAEAPAESAEGAAEETIEENPEEKPPLNTGNVIRFVVIGIIVVFGVIIIRFISLTLSRSKRTKRKISAHKRCPNCGSARLRKGHGDMYCANCGVVLGWV